MTLTKNSVINKISVSQWQKYLGDQSRVAHGRRQADAQPLKVAVDYVGLGDKAEGAQIAQTYSSQDDVAELAAG